jgi:hypothetical protein
MGGALPLTLPSGCLLRVWPDAVLFHVTDVWGQATQTILIPNQQALIGTRLFAQWLQAPLLPFNSSPALALLVGL